VYAQHLPGVGGFTGFFFIIAAHLLSYENLSLQRVYYSPEDVILSLLFHRKLIEWYDAVVLF